MFERSIKREDLFNNVPMIESGSLFGGKSEFLVVKLFSSIPMKDEDNPADVSNLGIPKDLEESLKKLNE